ncbi:MAG: terminase large subunit domain-containing protein [Candidatus Onthoplasma sp.]
MNLIEEILKIEKIQAERKEKNKLFSYNTGEKIHKKQIEFHACLKKNRWVFGGNRSGKTECGAVEVVYFARGVHPYRKITRATSGWVVSLSTQVQRDVAQSKILNYLNPDWIEDVVMLSGRKDNYKNGIIDYILVKNVFGTTSKIGFKSCDQGREKFQGTSLDYVWFDEEPPYDIYTECRMRVLDKNGDIFGTMTPLKGMTFVYDEIFLNKFNDPNIWYEFMQWDDNPYISEQAKQAMKQSMSEDELKSRQYGEFMDCGGRVYPEFDENLNVIEPFDIPYDWQDKLSIDPGLKNPLSCHWYAVDFDGNVYVVAEHYDKEKDIEFHSKRIHEISDSLGWHRNPNGMIEALIDSAANQTTLASKKSVADLFYDHGILVNTNVNKDVFSGIQRVKAMIKNGQGQRKLFIFNTCVNMIREIKAYRWGSGDSPVKVDDHSMDELRYYIMNRPENKKQKEEKSIVQKEKERLMRSLKFKTRR